MLTVNMRVGARDAFIANSQREKNAGNSAEEDERRIFHIWEPRICLMDRPFLRHRQRKDMKDFGNKKEHGSSPFLDVMSPTIVLLVHISPGGIREQWTEGKDPAAHAGWISKLQYCGLSICIWTHLTLETLSSPTFNTMEPACNINVLSKEN